MDKITIVDERTGKKYELPIENGTVRAMDLRKIKANDDDFGLMTYDPAFMNTASCRSSITFIDGDKGILQYRGYPIEQLAEKSTYLEVAYLLLHGELPTDEQLAAWESRITHHTFIHENIKKLMDCFHYDAHPMGMLVATAGALSTFYPDAKSIFEGEVRAKQISRLIANPSPTPSCGRVRRWSAWTKGSKMRSRASGAIPSPVSRTCSCTQPVPGAGLASPVVTSLGSPSTIV